MNLKLGKMTSKELAAWFGISYNTYKNKISKYIEKLEDYATFTTYRGGVNISEIFIFQYNKDLNFERDLVFSQMIKSADYGLASISGLAEISIIQGEQKSESALRYQYTKSRDKLFGLISSDSEDDKSEGGILGYRQLVWGIKLDVGKYRPLTEEEQKLLDNLIRSFYGANVDKVKLSLLLEEQFKTTDMTKQEYLALKEIKGCNFYNEVIKQFKDCTGLTLSSPNLYVFGENFDLTQDEKEYRKRIMSAIDQN